MESAELSKFLEGVGNAIHSINTIAVALALLPKDGEVEVPQELNISWKPSNIQNSKIMSRRFAEKSAYVYAAENLFVYIDNISKNPFWIYEDINFGSDTKKAERVNNFLSEIPGINKSQAILCELLCHWRNRIVHFATSKARLSSNNRQYLESKKEQIYDKYHHFNVEMALDNFKNGKITLKDTSTLITISIVCARKVDEYFHKGHERITNINDIREILLDNSNFSNIYKQQQSQKRERQSKKWIELNFPYLSDEIKNNLFIK